MKTNKTVTKLWNAELWSEYLSKISTQFPNATAGTIISSLWEEFENFTSEGTNKLEKILQKQLLLEEKYSSLSHRQNVSDSLFFDKIDEVHRRIDQLNFEKQKSKIEEIQILLSENLSTLFEILDLPDNWNQYGAKRFNSDLIFKCINFLRKIELDYQPEIFPTPQNSIQFEFRPALDYLLQVEIFTDKFTAYKRIGDSKTFLENISEAKAIGEISIFRQEFRDWKSRVSIQSSLSK